NSPLDGPFVPQHLRVRRDCRGRNARGPTAGSVARAAGRRTAPSGRSATSSLITPGLGLWPRCLPGMMVAPGQIDEGVPMLFEDDLYREPWMEAPPSAIATTQIPLPITLQPVERDDLPE